MSGFSAFLWQAALLLLVAYFIGAWIGCLLRRSFSGPPKVAMESDHQSHGAVAGAAAALATGGAAGLANSDDGAARFGRALDGGEPSSPHSSGVAPPPPKTYGSLAQLQRKSPDAAGSVATATPRQPEPAPEPPAAPEPISERQPDGPIADVPTGASSSGPVDAFTPPMTAAEAGAAARAARSQSDTVAPVEDGGNQQETTSDAGSEEQNDGNDAPTPLAADEPTSATTSVAARMEHLSAPSPSAQTPVVMEPAPDLPVYAGLEGQAVVAAEIVSASEDGTADEPDDLTMIEGVSAADSVALANAGVSSFGDIADWSASDVRRISGVIGGDRRIARENWIEQAQLLRSGGLTAFARRAKPNLAPQPETLTAAPYSHTAAAAVAAAAAMAPSPPVTDADTSSTTPKVSELAAFSGQRNGYRDDLQQIDGINAEVEQLLNDQGVARIKQIADWAPSEAKRIDRLLGGMNRVHREAWVRQARHLSGYRDVTPDHEDNAAIAPSTEDEATSVEPAPASQSDEIVTASADNAIDAAGPAVEAASPDDASAPQTLFDTADNVADEAPASGGDDNVVALGRDAGSSRNMRGLRSVHSEALVGGQGEIDGEPGDDLKRIRGVGVLIEKRLRSMGYTSYQQIGSWTQSDVDRVNQKLDFRGRIERENWIEQARILAAGGQTDFSRRSDRRDD
jgi:predicted flap endonuclease-1-like 5' DNA nuclease